MQTQIALPRGFRRRRNRLECGLGLWGGLGLGAARSLGSSGAAGPTPPITSGLVTDMNASLPASVTLATTNTMIQVGTSPSIVLAGTPSSVQATGASPFVSITIGPTGGARGTATFGWSKDGVVQATNIPTAASVPLTGTGLTATFAVGTYNAGDAYSGFTGASAWADQSGAANNWSAPIAVPPYVMADASLGGRPSIGVKTGFEIFGTLTVAQPDTIYCVCWLALTAGGDAFDGHTTRQAIGMDATSFYVYAGTILHLPGRDTAMHCIAGAFNGASTNGYIDSSTPVNGAAGANSLVGPSVAGGFPSSGGGVGRVLIYNNQHNSTQVGQTLAYLASIYGTSWH